MAGNIIIAGNLENKNLISEYASKKIKGINISLANSKDQIMDMIKRNDIHVCVIDTDTINEESYHFLEEAIREADSRNILMIVCSKNSDEEYISKILTMGVYDYFIKPFNKIELKTVLPLKIKNGIKLMKRQKHINYLSYHDELTDLYNRRFFDEEIKRLDTKRQLPISVIFADINNFKNVNDLYGHEIGDEVLKQMALMLKKACREEDIIARWGGDEFIVLLPQTGEKQIKAICKIIDDYCRLNCKKLLGTNLALGYSTKENSIQEIMEIIKNAEEWMYLHKIIEKSKSLAKIY